MSKFEMVMYLTLAGVALVAYLIGSIPFGYMVVKGLTGQDIRQVGSGSTGATNVKRVLGKGWFFTVMALDALKGAAAVILTMMAVKFSYWGWAPVVAGIFVLLGHSKSVFLGFKGGKSVASGVGVLLALSFPVGIIVAVLWAIITYVSKYVSLGSIIAISIAPWLMMFFAKDYPYVLFAVIAAAYVVWLHKDNIKRLTEGTENKVR